MRILLAIGLIVALGVGGAAAANSDEHGDIQAIKALFEQYNTFWNKGEMGDIGAQIYSAPVLLLGPNSAHFAIPTGQDLAKRWKAFRDSSAKNGADTSSVKTDSDNVCLLRNDVAIAAVVFSFRQVDGTTRKSSWFYMLQKNNAKWHIVAITRLDPQRRIACED